MSDALQQSWNTLATFVPKFLAFLVVLIVGWLIVKAITRGLTMLLRRVGFERVLERAGIDRMLHNASFNGTDLLVKVVHYALLLMVLQAAFGVFGPNAVSSLLNSIVAFIPKAIVALVIVAITMAIANVVKDIILNTMGGLSYGRTVANVASAVIIFMGVIAALNQVGIATTVTTPLLVTILATVGGILIVGVGGGLITPMRSRWENWLSVAENESVNVRQQMGSRPARARSVEDGGVYDLRDQATEGSSRNN